MANFRIEYPMEKRGQIELVAIGILIIATSIVAGSLYSEKIISHYRYVGDIETQTIYDLSTCDISHLQKENKIYFSDVSQAVDYHEAECNS